MSEKLVTKSELEATNKALESENDDLASNQSSLEKRLLHMEALIQNMEAEGEYAGPEPVLYHDPFDLGINPHHIKKHPEGKILSWKNPNIRNGSRGWRGWVPITYDSEIGKSLLTYISDPPAKMEGIASQDNYVRRGTDSILCWIEEEMYLARQQKRETKALRKQFAAQAARNTSMGRGVETFGDGAQIEKSPVGGFKRGGRTSAPPMAGDLTSRTNMLDTEE